MMLRASQKSRNWFGTEYRKARVFESEKRMSKSWMGVTVAKRYDGLDVL
jgi:hypothetical protein